MVGLGMTSLVLIASAILLRLDAKRLKKLRRQKTNYIAQRRKLMASFQVVKAKSRLNLSRLARKKPTRIVSEELGNGDVGVPIEPRDSDSSLEATAVEESESEATVTATTSTTTTVAVDGASPEVVVVDSDTTPNVVVM